MKGENRISVDKKELRDTIILQRRAIPTEEYTKRSKRIVHHILSLEEIHNANVLHVFWPITRNREVDIRPLISAFQKMGRQIVLPYVLSFSSGKHESPRLEHRVFTGETNLRANRWDVYEPTNEEKIPLSAFDAVIVPALAVDHLGFRLGYGKGYYDEFLAEVQCPTICPVYDAFLVDTLPRDKHDVAVSIVVSEKAVLRID